MKCKNCEACVKGYFENKPRKYVCIGVPEPFIISDINEQCTVYEEKNQEEIWSWNETYRDDWTHGTFSSREDAIEDALVTKKAWNISDKLIGIIHVGKCEYIPFPTSVDVERVLEDIDEQYYSETGYEDYIYDGVSNEDIEWLEDKMSALMCEFHQRIKLQPGLFTVVEQEEVDLNRM